MTKKQILSLSSRQCDENFRMTLTEEQSGVLTPVRDLCPGLYYDVLITDTNDDFVDYFIIFISEDGEAFKEMGYC